MAAKKRFVDCVWWVSRVPGLRRETHQVRSVQWTDGLLLPPNHQKHTLSDYLDKFTSFTSTCAWRWSVRENLSHLLLCVRRRPLSIRPTPARIYDSAARVPPRGCRERCALFAPSMQVRAPCTHHDAYRTLSTTAHSAQARTIFHRARQGSFAPFGTDCRDGRGSHCQISRCRCGRPAAHRAR